MIRSVLSAAALACLLVAPVSALADTASQSQVAGAFIAAEQAQDHTAALRLMGADVQIEFPSGAAQGQPFVIGYLDGLFAPDRGLDLDSQSLSGDCVRFQAHDRRSLDRYAIEVQVRGGQVVKVTVSPQTATGQTLASAETATLR